MMYPFTETTRTAIAQRCASFTRQAPRRDIAGLKRAAVAITLVESNIAAGETAFLLTRRAKGLRAHGGQWALPGGRCDGDETPTEAARRELDEELALKLGEDDVLGILDDYPTRSGYLITPVVLWASSAARPRPNPDEVASVHYIPLTDIMPEDVINFLVIPESDRPVVRIRINGDFINAPTAALIYQFREVIAGRQTRVADFEQPVFAWK
jgi:8-oxo-dGTP pyrophosphatase MutT (NUDIX family)